MRSNIFFIISGDNVTVNCTRLLSSLNPLVATETTMNMTLFDQNVLYIKGMT